MNESMNQNKSQPDRATDRLAIRTERWLRQLPGRRAPSTLAPRVLAELARRARLAWYRRPWTDWPEHYRWFSLIVLATAVAGGTRLLETGSQVAVAKAPSRFSAVAEVPLYLEVAESGTRVLLGLAYSLPTLWWWTALGLIAGILAAALGLGAAAWRLVRSSIH
jgi:hypothetical protein